MIRKLVAGNSTLGAGLLVSLTAYLMGVEAAEPFLLVFFLIWLLFVGFSIFRNAASL